MEKNSAYTALWANRAVSSTYEPGSTFKVLVAAAGIEENLVSILSQFDKIPVTYAGGVGTYEDLEQLNCLGKGKIDVTIGSALDLFGGTIAYERVKLM